MAQTKRYIHDLRENTLVDETFVLADKEMRRSRAGKTYLVMKLSDKTGSIVGYHFEPSPREIEIPVGAPVAVRGVVGTYKDTKKITVEAMIPVNDAPASEFLAHSPRSRYEMLNELRDLVATVKDPLLGSLLRTVFGDKKFMEQFCLSPASVHEHHDYLGGLLEHTVSVATLCDKAAQQYVHVQKDVLVTAAILRDVGQVDALEFDTTVRLTAKGRLLGHAALSLHRVQEAARLADIDTSSQMYIDVQHAVVMHHGSEHEGTRQPSTFEAVMLCDINALDVHAASFIQATQGAARADEAWTNDDNPFNRPLLVPRAAS